MTAPGVGNPNNLLCHLRNVQLMLSHDKCLTTAVIAKGPLLHSPSSRGQLPPPDTALQSGQSEWTPEPKLILLVVGARHGDPAKW